MHTCNDVTGGNVNGVSNASPNDADDAAVNDNGLDELPLLLDNSFDNDVNPAPPTIDADNDGDVPVNGASPNSLMSLLAKLLPYDLSSSPSRKRSSPGPKSPK
jgi:hypothetical protein